MEEIELKPCPFCHSNKGSNCICPDMITKDAKEAWQNSMDEKVKNIMEGK